jgi:hypothetical protein
MWKLQQRTWQATSPPKHLGCCIQQHHPILLDFLAFRHGQLVDPSGSLLITRCWICEVAVFSIEDDCCNSEKPIVLAAQFLVLKPISFLRHVRNNAQA